MAVELGQVYKCEQCGMILEVIHPAEGAVECCDGPATLQVANTVDAAKEKHVPVITAEGSGCKVAVGSVPHPMLDTHYIEWIEVMDANGRCARQYLKPGDEPAASFCLPAGSVVAREYCNLHGLWKGE